MKQHQYHITVEHLTDAKGNPSEHDAPLVFGLKLLSEVMLEKRSLII